MNRRFRSAAARRQARLDYHFAERNERLRAVPASVRVQCGASDSGPRSFVGSVSGSTVHWWACACGAHGKATSAEDAQRGYEAHLAQGAPK